MQRFSDLSVIERAASLVDAGSLRPLDDEGLPPTLWLGRGTVGGKRILLALTDGRQRGGTVGIDEARAFSRLVAAAAAKKPDGIVIVWDTGGVRVQEGPVALAAASAVGVGLCQAALRGVPVITVISPPRGCFGAPSVIAATSHAVLQIEGAHWGLTGPELLSRGEEGTADRRAFLSSATARVKAGAATARIVDSVERVRLAVREELQRPLVRVGAQRVLAASASATGSILARWKKDSSRVIDDESTRQRDFFRYSFRGRWKPGGEITKQGLVQSSWGEVDGEPAMGIIVGPERSVRGLGIEDADAIVAAIGRAIARPLPRPAPIVTFLFCRGHSNDIAEERAGVHAALAECLRSMVTARLLGHPLLCVLGGGAYGAAYLVLAAPSHRVLAIRGTSVAPMAPNVLAAFQKLRGVREDDATPANLADLIPEIQIVDSVVRLPGVLRRELTVISDTLPVGRRRSSRFTVSRLRNGG